MIEPSISKFRAGTQVVPRGSRTVRTTLVGCPTATCRITNVKGTVNVRGLAYQTQVRYDSSNFGSGQSRTIEVTIPKRAYDKLKSKKSGVINTTVTALVNGSGSVTKTIRTGIRR